LRGWNCRRAVAVFARLPSVHRHASAPRVKVLSCAAGVCEVVATCHQSNASLRPVDYIKPLAASRSGGSAWSIALAVTGGRNIKLVNDQVSEQVFVAIGLQRLGVCITRGMGVSRAFNLAFGQAFAGFGKRRLRVHGVGWHWNAPRLRVSIESGGADVNGMR